LLKIEKTLLFLLIFRKPFDILSLYDVGSRVFSRFGVASETAGFIPFEAVSGFAVDLLS